MKFEPKKKLSWLLKVFEIPRCFLSSCLMLLLFLFCQKDWNIENKQVIIVTKGKNSQEISWLIFHLIIH